jgi:hypothetical protein
MDKVKEVNEIIKIPRDELIEKGMLAFLEKEIRLTEIEISDIRDKYDAADKEILYNLIKSKSIHSHPAWEDYLTWKNKENYLEELKIKLKIFDDPLLLLYIKIRDIATSSKLIEERVVILTN